MFNIDTISSLIQSRFSSFVKKGINLSPHFIPLNLKALDRSIGSILNAKYNTDLSETSTNTNKKFNTREFRDRLYNHLRGKYKDTIILKTESYTVNGRKDVSLQDLLGKFTPALVFSNTSSKDTLVGVLFNSYSIAQAEFLNSYLNKEILKELGGFIEENKSLDLAYIFRNESTANSTIGTKIKQIFGIFNSISNNSVSVGGLSTPDDKSSLIQTKLAVESLLKDYAVHQERQFGSYSVTLTKDVTDFVNKIRADILIIHDSSVKEEVRKNIESSDFINKIAGILPNTKVYTSTLIDNIKTKIRSIFLGKKTKIPIRETTSTKKTISKAKSSVKVSTSKGIKSEFIIPPQFRSLISIQNLLNKNLSNAIKDQMGDGSRNDVLNYRTGRLADSFEVTAISQDRQGAMTAFFTYMKYPYATFARGGTQSQPRSRDPVFLGDKAIRSIAEKLMSEKFRTVGI